MATSFPQAPDPFLTPRVHKLDLDPDLCALCAGYELGKWRDEQLADHLLKWLPEFALRHSELQDISPATCVQLLARAAHTVYTTPKFAKRGEAGELLLHIAIRQVHKTVPAISKYFYKDSRNNTVKGFDAVHVVVADGCLELWLGEAKFYDNILSAITDVVNDLEAHTQRDYLRAEFAAILGKIDPSWEHADKLKLLLKPEVSLDNVFDRMCIPVLLTYDSPAIASHTEVTKDYQAAFEREVLAHRGTFASKKLPKKIKLHLFLVPLKSKEKLQELFDKRLKACQQISSP